MSADGGFYTMGSWRPFPGKEDDFVEAWGTFAGWGSSFEGAGGATLVRDMTDTMYNSRKRPFVSHFRGTDLVVEHIERYWCPTITSDQIVGGSPFRFAADTGI